VDFLGKMDKKIAKVAPDLEMPRPGHNKYDLNYSIKQLQPDYIQSASWLKQNLEEWTQSRYQLITYKNWNLLLRKDSTAINWKKALTQRP
ncbi:MAG: hypothetical protein WCS37_13560, partial [Chloroflexota bacterium]